MLCDIAVSGTLSEHITTKHGKTTAKIPSTKTTPQHPCMNHNQLCFLQWLAVRRNHNAWTGTRKCCLDQVHPSIDGGVGQECTREGAPSGVAAFDDKRLAFNVDESGKIEYGNCMKYSVICEWNRSTGWYSNVQNYDADNENYEDVLRHCVFVMCLCMAYDRSTCPYRFQHVCPEGLEWIGPFYPAGQAGRYTAVVCILVIYLALRISIIYLLVY